MGNRPNLGEFGFDGPDGGSATIQHTGVFGGITMLRLAALFLLLAVLAAPFGYLGIGGEWTLLARICFFACLVLFIVSASASALLGKSHASD